MFPRADVRPFAIKQMANGWVNKKKGSGTNMGRGPRWSDVGVKEMLDCLRIRLEATDLMDEGRLKVECEKRGIKVDRAGLKDWFWENVIEPAPALEKENGVSAERIAKE